MWNSISNSRHLFLKLLKKLLVIEFFAELVPAIKIVPGMVQEVIPEQEIDIIILHFLMKESSEKRLVRS